jgi:hypothetical protein
MRAMLRSYGLSHAKAISPERTETRSMSGSSSEP